MRQFPDNSTKIVPNRVYNNHTLCRAHFGKGMSEIAIGNFGHR